MVFIIGLPKPLHRRLEVEAGRNGTRVLSVLADIGKEGTLQLVPFPGQAISDLQAYVNLLGSHWENAVVIVLPYAAVPLKLDDELEVIEQAGGLVVRPAQGQDGWVKLEQRRPGDAFLNGLFRRLISELFEEFPCLPTEYFRTVSENSTQVLIADGALDSCDLVAPHRRKFLRDVADAFAELVAHNGSGGRVDAFFKKWGLDHAQTGGINATLKLHKDGKCFYNETSNTHLKQGDKTTPEAAARVYYQSFVHETLCYVAVLYAGPHPNSDVTRNLYF